MSDLLASRKPNLPRPEFKVGDWVQVLLHVKAADGSSRRVWRDGKIRQVRQKNKGWEYELYDPIADSRAWYPERALDDSDGFHAGERSIPTPRTRSVSKLDSPALADDAESTAPLISSNKGSLGVTEPIIPSTAGIEGLVMTRADAGISSDGSLSTRKDKLGMRKNSSEPHQDADIIEAHYSMTWDPVEFYNSQLYDADYPTFVEEAVVVTGSSGNAEATTIGEYIRRVWPSISDDLIGVLKDLHYGPSLKNTSAKIRASFDPRNGTIRFNVKGPQSDIKDTQEALAWLGAGLRRTASETEQSQCRATVSSTSPIDVSPCAFSISFSFEPLKTRCEGTCWLDFFQSINVVSGFPIRERPSDMPGLELPLGLMAALVESKCVTHFSGHFFIKGYSTMLVLMKRDRKVHAWHLLINKTGDRISYNDDQVEEISPLTIEDENDVDLSSGRHIVGWCSVVQTLAGTPSANYEIEASGLQPPSDRHVVDRFSVSAAKYISVGFSGIISKKQKSLQGLSPNVYEDKLTWASNEHVLFFDVNDRRGWLLNGRTALLHLVRASLKHSKDTNSHFIFNPTQLEEAGSDITGSDAARLILESSTNRKLRLSKLKEETTEEVSIEEPGPRIESSTTGEEPSARNTSTLAKMTTVRKTKVTYYCFEDKVEAMFSLLERAIDALDNCNEQDGHEISFGKGSELRGYDFRDFVAPRGRKEPKAFELKSNGSSWVGFVRECKAITLFGTGFGDLLKASETSQAVCSYRKAVPCGENYLAISIEDLKTSLSRVNDRATVARKIREDHDSQHHNLFEPCYCGDHQGQDRCDKGRVLELEKSSPHPSTLPEHGAVILGHTVNRLPWRSIFKSSGRSPNLKAHKSVTPRSSRTAPMSNRVLLPDTFIQEPPQTDVQTT